MTFLFGDSTESTLELNYLAFLRDAIDFAVGVLQSDAALASGRERQGIRERGAAESIHAVESFGRTTLQLTEPVAKGAPDSPVGRAASSVGNATAEVVRREVAQIRAGLASDLELIEGEAARLRGRCVALLGTLMAAHDLPDAEESLVVHWTGTGYEARVGQKSGYGLEVVLGLEIPGSSMFAHDVRVDKIADAVEIHAPETAGWLKKEIKMVPHRLGRHHLTELTVDDDGITVQLRATPEAGASGFDIAIARGGDIRIERLGSGADGGNSFDTDDRDIPNLQLLAGRLEDAAATLREHRRTVVSATLDGISLSDHSHPRVLAERLIDAMAPVVQLIASHSLAPSELVLKRLLAGDRREEIFVSKAELAQKLEPLPMALRRAFAPLGIVDAAPAHGHLSAEPPPLPPRAARKTGAPPPPPPPPRVTAEQSAAAVDSALRELDEASDKS